MADAPVQTVINVVTVGSNDPYPTGTPAVTNLANIHTPQERTIGPVGVNGNLWERQKIQNLAAHGLIAGGAAGT